VKSSPDTKPEASSQPGGEPGLCKTGKIKELMELIVYSAFWCPDCREAKRFLAKHNVPYKEIDIETTPGAAEEVVRRSGKRAIPQFVIDGEWVQPYRPGEGFLHDEMAKRLGIENP
jgi:mycoredoxin